MKSLSVFLVLFSYWGLAQANIAGLITTAHREAMTSNGGLTNQCSGGQFVNNPAGIHCEYAGVSESFGSTNISSMSVTIDNQSLKDLQKTNNQISPGLSVFLQSFHEGDTSFGFGGFVNNVQFEKSFEYAVESVRGVIDIGSTVTELKLGGYYTKKIDKMTLGAVLALSQEERHDTQFFKYKIQSSYTTQQTNKITLEQFVSPSVGAIWQVQNQKYGLSLSKLLSISGHFRSDGTDIYTNGNFNEKGSDGVVRSERPLALALGASTAFDKSVLTSSLTGEAHYKDHDGDDGSSNTAPALISLGFGYEYLWSNKVSVLAGIRKYHSISEADKETTTNSDMFSAGFVRKYKGVEIGTGFGFTHLTQESFSQTTRERSSLSEITRADVTFSSSFTY